jgi:ParB family chromosome partitioning protein
VRPYAEGGYVIISGERRWRAAGIAGLDVVPCLVAADGDHDAGRNTLTQLSENLQRSNLKLLDVASALRRCLDETGLGQSDLAKELGKSKSWVSKYLALLKAEGPFRAALDEGLLGNPETARMFGRLGARQQEALLRRARRENAPIGHAEVSRLDRRRDEAGRPDPVMASAHGGTDSPEIPDSRRDPLGAQNEPCAGTPEDFTIRLSSAQLRFLVESLGGASAGDGDLLPVLFSLLPPPR